MTTTGYLRLGRYRAETLLGAGGVTETYRARSVEGADTGKTYALKLLRADRGGTEEIVVAAFLDAARRAATLRLPGVARVVEVVEGGDPFVVSELIAGVSLARLCDESGGRVAPKAAGLIGAQIAETLGDLHAAGGPHGGIAPGNVIVTASGAVVLLDVGIAAAVRPLTENPIESWLYSAPELVVGDEATAAADLYSLGATIYYLLSGRPPFEAETRDDLLTAMEAGPRPLHDVPTALMETVARLLSTAAAERPSASAAARVLQGSLLRGELAEMTPAPLAPAPAPRSIAVAAPVPSQAPLAPLISTPFTPAAGEFLEPEPASDPDPEPALELEPIPLGPPAVPPAYAMEEVVAFPYEASSAAPLFDVEPEDPGPPVDLPQVAPEVQAAVPEVIAFPAADDAEPDEAPPLLEADDPNVGVVYDEDEGGGGAEKGRRNLNLPKRGGAARRKGRFAWAYLVGGLVLLAGGAGAVFFVMDPLGLLQAREVAPPPLAPPPRLDAGPPTPRMTPGELVVHTKPPGAAVWVDGVERGKTPLKIMTTPGGHRLVVTKEGFRMLRAVADTADGALLEKTLDRVDTVLTGAATLHVLCQTKGKYPVFVDGKEIGLYCPAEGLRVTPGAHMVGVFVIPQNKIWSFEREVLSGTKPHKVVFSY